MTCLSRRAFADRYSFMLYKEENGQIKEKNYIWLEYRCPNEVSEEGEFCIQCSKKEGPNYVNQAVPKFDHGIVGGPYTLKSKLYGSNYYLNLIKNGWQIKPEDERRAKEEQQKANMVKAKINESGGLKIKANKGKVSETPTVSETPKVSDIPRKQPKIRIKKSTKKPVVETGEPAEYIESMEPPIYISQEDIIVVKVKKIRCSGTEYYYDDKSGKVFASTTKGVGLYKGRYNSESDTIDTTYPDSDYE